MQKIDIPSYNSIRVTGKLFDTVVEYTVASKSFGPGEAYDRDMEAEGYKGSY